MSSILQRLMRVTGMCPDTLPTVPSALEHLLSSNDPPSDAEASLLRGVQALFSTHLTRLDDEIASLLSSPDSGKIHALEQLEDGRAVLQDRSRQVSSTLSTFRRFPKEILQEIFFELIPDVGFMVLDPLQGAWAASRVCSRWRSASRHPHLWTTLRITSGTCSCIGGGGFSHRCPTFVRYKNPLEILRTALRYSGSCKLDLHVEIQCDDCVGNRSRIYRLLDVLMSHSERWEYVSLTVPNELGTYLGGVEGKLPELRQLTFIGCDPKSALQAWREDGAPRVSAFAVAPKLRHVSVENTLLLLDYSLLTSFTANYSVHFPEPVPPRFIIGCCVHLHYMEANLVGHTANSDLTVDTVKPILSNTSLAHLTINDPALLAYLSLPALSSLDIGDMSRSSCLSFIPPFLNRSQCSLTRLYFRDSALFGEPLPNILQLVPYLTDLGIGFHTYSDTIARHIPHIGHVLMALMKSLSEVLDEERHQLVPRLESFDVVFCIYRTDWRFVGPDLVKLLSSRKGIMRRAWFRWAASSSWMGRFPNLNHASIIALREMKDKGLDIAICALDGEGSVL